MADLAQVEPAVIEAQNGLVPFSLFLFVNVPLLMYYLMIELLHPQKWTLIL